MPVEQDELKQRNDRICMAYAAGQTMAEIGLQFKLHKQRIQQILRSRGVWRARPKSDRTHYVGVSVRKDTRDALKKHARKAGVSVSQLASEALDKLVCPPSQD